MKPYRQYKDSGIEWVGKIPENWEGKKLKYTVTILDSMRIPLSSAERAEKKGSIPYYGATGIIDYIDDFIFEGKHILIGEDGAPFFINNKDVSFIADGIFWVNNHAHILKANNSNIPEFISHYLNSVDYRLYITGSTRDKLTQEDLSSIKFVSPSLSEQKQIAKYLDHKTAKIDSLIEKKKKLIGLLKEERTSVINQAVTKGLDPNVPMKDSGIEWLGEIPEHWEVKRLKYVTDIQGRIGFRGYKVSDLVAEGLGAYTIGAKHIDNKNVINLTSPEFISWEKYYESPEIMVNVGDVIVTQRGTLGKVAIIYKDIGPATINPSMVLLKNITLYNKYLYYIFNAHFILEEINLINTATAVPMISQSQLAQFIVFSPPLPEQKKIARYLEKETYRIDTIISKSEKEIEILQEYRTALISEIVTGKIDVREGKI